MFLKSWINGGPERPFWKRRDFWFYTLFWTYWMAIVSALWTPADRVHKYHAASNPFILFAIEFAWWFPFGFLFGWLSSGFNWRRNGGASS